MRGGLLACTVALAGCDVVFGLERPPPGSDAVDASPEQLRVTVEIGQREIHDDAGGTTSRFVPLATLPRVLLDDGTEATTTPTATGFEFQRRQLDQAYRFTYKLHREVNTTTLVSRAADVHVVAPVFGRLEREPVQAGTLASVVLPAQTTRTTWVLSTGIRTKTLINSTPNPVTGFAFDWSTRTSLSGPLGLPSSAAGDRLHVATYDLLGGYYTIATFASGPLTLVQGTTTPVPLGPPVVLIRTCLDLTARRGREYQRVQAAAGAIDFLKTSWTIASTPDREVTSTGTLPLAYSDTSTIADMQERVQFSNPLGEQLLVEMTADGVVEIGGGATAVVGTSTFALVPPVPACSDPIGTLAVEGTTGFPTAITVDGDRITWGLMDGVADYFVVTVQEIGAPEAPFYLTTDRELVVNPGTFVSGTRYYVRVSAGSGRPDAVSGDYRTHVYPVGAAWMVSPAFTAP